MTRDMHEHPVKSIFRPIADLAVNAILVLGQDDEASYKFIYGKSTNY